MNPRTRLALARLLAFIVVIGISIYVFSLGAKAEKLAMYGYAGIFLLAFLAYATVLLPAPGIAIIFMMGGTFNPWGVALAAGAGAALGELSGYLVGFSGQAIVEHRDTYEKIVPWMEKNGPLTILILATIPNPLFDVAGVVAGMLKMPLRKFLFWVWIGETIKMWVFAFLGFTWMDHLYEWLRGLVSG